MSRWGQALVLSLGLGGAALAAWITVDQRQADALADAVLTVRTHNFDGTTRGRLDPYFQAHPQHDWRLAASADGDRFRVDLWVDETRFQFVVSDDEVVPADDASRGFVERLRTWSAR